MSLPPYFAHTYLPSHVPATDTFGHRSLPRTWETPFISQDSLRLWPFFPPIHSLPPYPARTYHPSHVPHTDTFCHWSLPRTWETEIYREVMMIDKRSHTSPFLWCTRDRYPDKKGAISPVIPDWLLSAAFTTPCWKITVCFSGRSPFLLFHAVGKQKREESRRNCYSNV